jgi:hypothetical protein
MTVVVVDTVFVAAKCVVVVTPPVTYTGDAHVVVATTGAVVVVQICTGSVSADRACGAADAP